MGSGFYSIIFSTLFYSSFLLYRLFLKLQIAGQNQVQFRGRFCHKAAALVEDGLFQRVAGKTAVAGGAAVQRLTALVVAPAAGRYSPRQGGSPCPLPARW